MKSKFPIDIEKGNNMEWRQNIYSILIKTSIFQLMLLAFLCSVIGILDFYMRHKCSPCIVQKYICQYQKMDLV